MPSLCVDGSKERVPPRFRWCNDRYFVAVGSINLLWFVFFMLLLDLSFLSLLFLMPAEKRRTGKDWLSSVIIPAGHEISEVFCLCFWWRVFLCDYVDVIRSSPSFCSSLSSNSTKLFSEETSTIAVPQRPVFNHWTLCINITLIYWTKPYEVWRSTCSFLNKCLPLRGMVEQNTQDSIDCWGFRQA